MHDHEKAFVLTFIVRDKQQRYLELLSNAKRRPKILGRLNHKLDIDWSLARLIKTIAWQSVQMMLEDLGATSTCHVIADESPLDGTEQPLSTALDYAYNHPFGIILSCISGQLAFYKPESPGPAYLLRATSVEVGGKARRA